MADKTISDADRHLAEKMLADESGKPISDADRHLAEKMLEKFLRRNDGGIASKTRIF
jgi:hypothetical protein